MDETFNSVATKPFPDFNTDLPEYIPVHPNLRLSNEFSQIQHLKTMDESLLSVAKSVQKFLNYAAGNPHLLQDPDNTVFLESQEETYANILRSKLQLQTLQDSLRTAHQGVSLAKSSEMALNLGNLHVYKNVDRPDFADVILSKLDDSILSPKVIENRVKNDNVLQFIRHAKFVLENPEDPLPDESTDEELAVSGGKISLKDPLSMDFFSEPVMSKVCHHVFEQKYIKQQLGRNRQIDCPITGCEAKVSDSDLQQDLLMALRVKVFQARDKKREQRVRI